MPMIINTIALSVKLEGIWIKGEPVRGDAFYATSPEDFEKQLASRYEKNFVQKIMKVVNEHFTDVM